MGFLNLKYFKLEKKKDGIYRCKGGHLADIIFLSSCIVVLLVKMILSPLKIIFIKIFKLTQIFVFALHIRK